MGGKAAPKKVVRSEREKAVVDRNRMEGKGEGVCASHLFAGPRAIRHFATNGFPSL